MILVPSPSLLALKRSSLDRQVSVLAPCFSASAYDVRTSERQRWTPVSFLLFPVGVPLLSSAARHGCKRKRPARLVRVVKLGVVGFHLDLDVN